MSSRTTATAAAPAAASASSRAAPAASLSSRQRPTLVHFSAQIMDLLWDASGNFSPKTAQVEPKCEQQTGDMLLVWIQAVPVLPIKRLRLSQHVDEC
jgi:hypothetical protein